MKSTLMWDHGHELGGTMSGTSFPYGRCLGVFDVAQMEKPLTYHATSWVIQGHQ